MDTHQLKKKIPITEVFSSIQGEGPRTGCSTVFVRTYGCNLRCTYCDSKYSISGGECKLFTESELLSKLDEIGQQPIVTFTGGEPLLYQSFIVDVAKRICSQIDIETNGTIAPTMELRKIVSTFVVSPKLSTSGVSVERSLDCGILRTFPIDKTYLKFVITDLKRDIVEIERILSSLTPIPVYLMPNCLTRSEYLKKAPKLAEFCVKNGYRFSPREHIVLWNRKRRV